MKCSLAGPSGFLALALLLCCSDRAVAQVETRDHRTPEARPGYVWVDDHWERAPSPEVRDHRDTEPARVVDHRRSYDGLGSMLAQGRWEDASRYSWELMLRAGDTDRNGTMTYAENDAFPCNDLRTLMDLWSQHYHASSGYNDVLLPRFHTRAVSCGIWSR